MLCTTFNYYIQRLTAIDQINSKLDSSESLLRDAATDDPAGYTCTMQNIEITDIVTHEQILCYNATEKTCSMVTCFIYFLMRYFCRNYTLQTQMTKFVPKVEKKCDTHFKKECDITYKEEVKI